MAKKIIIRPVVTEKSEKGMASKSVYTFIVERSVNKLEVANAIEAMFNVSVSSVNTAVIPGKMKVRSTRSGAVSGMRPAYKKAFVTLVKGETIALFGESTEEETEE
ncbi:MAG: 50S ribosomal protein L23 [Saprospiraceae bacterium]|nr:50S ribosomal protein L23 [Saprospiraceae bacterium]